MYRKTKHIHFVGIGGIGMSGIAELLLNLGYRISGSDMHETEITRRLKKLGGTVHIGHDGAWVDNADVVVISSAISEDNPEILTAQKAHIPVIPRAEMLAELMRLNKFGIAIAGSHGKTTTTSIVGWLLAQAGLDPTVVIGGKVDCFGGSNAKLGEGDFLVAEADESDGSFLKLAPVLEVVTNIDLEHLDYYSNIDEVKQVFIEFIDKVPFYGAAILCIDNPHVASILPEIKKRLITYGLTSQADVYARGITPAGLSSSFEVCHEDQVLGTISLSLAGLHNVYNALAAVTVGLELDIPFATIAAALSSFSGVQRRLQIKGERREITIVDDYGHHPTEIRATLSALRDAWPERRLVVLFQPHRYSRTKGLLADFYTAFHEADVLMLTEIYGAGEPPIEGISSEVLLNGIKKHGQRHAYCEPTLERLLEKTMEVIVSGDVVLTLGAGNIWQAGEQLLEMLAEEDG
jgi:UDP-N-acetylmuramate--alanine ligase